MSKRGKKEIVTLSKVSCANVGPNTNASLVSGKLVAMVC
jgi:hypothetical protein